LGIIGPNGAGKTTVFNLITGIYKPSSGRILFDGKDIANLAPHNIAKMGISRTFQNIELFPGLTVLDNVIIGQDMYRNYGFVSSGLRLKRVLSEEEKTNEEALEALKFVGLDSYRNQLPQNLPFGQRRLLELARALFMKPKLLLLDEPGAGMNYQEIRSLHQIILEIRARWEMTILLVEHVMQLVMEVSDRISVLNYGQKITEGTPAEVRNNEEVIKAYLGKGWRSE
jgi:branched-chain amino acid transport system ATP-binding protein